MTSTVIVKLLVKKVYEEKTKRNKRRNWKLKRLDVERDGSVATSEERWERVPKTSYYDVYDLLLKAKINI